MEVVTGNTPLTSGAPQKGFLDLSPTNPSDISKPLLAPALDSGLDGLDYGYVPVPYYGTALRS